MRSLLFRVPLLFATLTELDCQQMCSDVDQKYLRNNISSNFNTMYESDSLQIVHDVNEKGY